MTLKIGYYTQEIASDPSAGVAYMDPNKKVLDYISDTAEYLSWKMGRSRAMPGRISKEQKSGGAVASAVH